LPNVLQKFLLVGHDRSFRFLLKRQTASKVFLNKGCFCLVGLE
jgi:hypothetical protein